jgi:hypothetical protein
MKDGKLAVVEQDAEQVRLIFRRYLELSGVNALVRDLKERNIRTKTRLLATGGTRTDIEDIIVKSINEHPRSQSGMPAITGRSAIAGAIDRIDVHKDRLAVRLRPQQNPEATKPADTDDHLLSIPWRKPPSKRFREILLPHGVSRKEVRPVRPERRLRLVSAIARGRRWLDEIISGSVTNAEQIALRERCGVRHVNMTISFAFLAPSLVRAAVEGRLPRGINIERLRDAPAEWSRQFEALGLNPQ